MIILIFGFWAVSSVLAHDSAHSVPGITLPPGDANSLLFFIAHVGLSSVVKKKDSQSSIVVRYKNITVNDWRACRMMYGKFSHAMGG